jgi:hypothetical protein
VTTPNVNATPITDILVLANEVTPDTYGIRFNRVTLSSKAFRFILGTTEFANKAKTILGLTLPQVPVPSTSTTCRPCSVAWGSS